MARVARRHRQGSRAWVAIGSAFRPERRARELEKRRLPAAKRKERLSTATPEPPTQLVLPDVELAVGDLVVYGNHGIGRVAARRKQEMLGERQEVVVIELEQLTVTLPLTLARTQLRPLADKADLRRVGVALRDDEELNTRNWLSRRRDTLEKLIGGTPVELAQIISEGAQRERLRSSRGGTKGQLSLSERQLYTKARLLLANEVALALDIQPAAADTWIDGHLMRPS